MAVIRVFTPPETFHNEQNLYLFYFAVFYFYLKFKKKVRFTFSPIERNNFIPNKRKSVIDVSKCWNVLLNLKYYKEIQYQFAFR